MLLRSSSSPILGSLIAPPSAVFSESPNNGFQLHHKSLERPSSSVLHGISCRYSRPSDSSERDSSPGMRRSRSEGNIKDLLPDCSDESQSQRSLKPSSSRRRDIILESSPSLSLYCCGAVQEDEEEKQQEQDNYQIAESFSFLEDGENNGGAENRSSGEPSQWAFQPLFLARGLGIDRLASGLMNLSVDDGAVLIGAGNGDGRDGNYSVKTDCGGDDYELEVYYKRVIEEDPGNALILKNYAQFLHQCKRNLAQAEEYYSRAILADPDDAETISQYGKVIWELHADFERASAYIERAALMDQNNCFVQATYASFLWETGEEGEEDDDRSQELCGVPFHVGTLASAGA